MTLNPDLFVKALLTTDEYGSWQQVYLLQMI